MTCSPVAVGITWLRAKYCDVIVAGLQVADLHFPCQVCHVAGRSGGPRSVAAIDRQADRTFPFAERFPFSMPSDRTLVSPALFVFAIPCVGVEHLQSLLRHGFLSSHKLVNVAYQYRVRVMTLVRTSARAFGKAKQKTSRISRFRPYGRAENW